MNKWLPRNAFSLIKSTLEQSNCVLLLGPRQVGKTWLSRKLEEEEGDGAHYLDLEQKEERETLDSLDAFTEEHMHKLIILDEAQFAPDFFPRLRRLLDDQEWIGESKTRWLLLGSATTELQSLANSHLGGRFRTIKLTAIHLGELDEKKPATSDTLASGVVEIPEIQTILSTRNSTERLHQLWLRGGFPKSFLAEDDAESIMWRRDYLRSIFGHQSIANKLVARATLLEPLWEHLSINQGEPCNIHQQLGCRGDELKLLLNFLVESQLLRELRPWFRNESKRLNKSARYFIRDSGLLNVNWGFQTHEALIENSICGKSWEGFVVETLLSSAPIGTVPYFYRNQQKDEIDLILELNFRIRWAIEIKLSGNPTVSAGFYRATEDVGAAQRFVVHGGPDSFQIGKGSSIEALSLIDAVQRLKAYSL